MEVWTRPLINGVYAFAFLNLRDDGIPSQMSYKLKDMVPLSENTQYEVLEAFTAKSAGMFSPDDSFKAMVNPSGVYFAVVVPQSTHHLNVV